jgi:SAM-dependent methyltransferase
MVFERLKQSVALYYRDKLLNHGPTHRGVDWNSADSQRLRFDQLLKVCPPGEQFTINDYGCGYGALLDYIFELGYSCSYVGFDLSPEMIAAARKSHGKHLWVNFVTDDCPVADYTVASGIFNVRLDVPARDWQEYMLLTIRQMSDLSYKGFAFNALTSYSDPQHVRPDLYYANPCFLFDYCKRNFSKQVALLHDYGLYEFTIIVRKEWRL